MERSKLWTSQACKLDMKTTPRNFPLTDSVTFTDPPSVGVEDPVQPQGRVSPVQHGVLHADQPGALAGRPLLHLTCLSVGHLGEEWRTVAVSFYPVDHAGVQTVGHAVGEPCALNSDHYNNKHQVKGKR